MQVKVSELKKGLPATAPPHASSHSVFCLETAIKTLFWSVIMYDFEATEVCT